MNHATIHNPLLQRLRGMGYNPKKNDDAAASSDLRSDLNLHETHNGHSRAVEETLMSRMAPFPQDQHKTLMENHVTTPSFSSLNTPTPDAKWPRDLEQEPPASAAGSMNTPSVVMDSNPVYGGVNAPNSSPFMTRIPRDSRSRYAQCTVSLPTLTLCSMRCHPLTLSLPHQSAIAGQHSPSPEFNLVGQHSPPPIWMWYGHQDFSLNLWDITSRVQRCTR